MQQFVLRSSCIYTGDQDPFAGAVVIDGNRISNVIKGNDEMEGPNVLDLGNKTICAGAGDTHTFFTGWFINKPGIFEEMVDGMAGYLKDKDAVKTKFKEYMKMLNMHGITSIKEMTFDDSYGLKEIIKEMELEKELTVRIHFMSQPVKYPANLGYAEEMQKEYNSEWFSFSGFNQMTDGLIVSNEGDLLQPYEGETYCCKKDIPYEAIEKQVLDADRMGIRFTLHSEGDGSFHKILDIYEQCQKDKDGRLVNRHGITDLELTSEDDRKRMAEMGAFAECYVQMLMTDEAQNWIEDVTQKVGDRFSDYLNLRKLCDQGVVIAAATDLPFMIPDVPQSIVHGVYANAKDVGHKVNPDNALDLKEMLDAWTSGAQYAMGCEDRLGYIKAGMLADIIVFDKNIFELTESEFQDVKVEMTIVDGRIVYRRE